MAGGWSKDGAVQEQIDSSVGDAVAEVRSRLVGGHSLLHCEACAEVIPEARRIAVPGVRLCIHCQNEIDSSQAKQHLFNRRGSKNSQLR